MSTALYALTFDCTDAASLAAFWAEVLGRLVDEGATEEFAAIGLGGPSEQGPNWMFVKVPEAKAAKNRMHCDLATGDLDGEIERLHTLGATTSGEFEENGSRWVTLADPEGNEFDVVAIGT